MQFFLVGVFLGVSAVATATGTLCPTELISNDIEELEEMKVDPDYPQKNMAAIPLSEWLKPRMGFAQQMRLREALYLQNPGKVFQFLPEHAEAFHQASRALLDRLVLHLSASFPFYYRIEGDEIVELINRRRFNFKNPVYHPLVVAGLLVPDDLILNLPDARKGGQWTMVGGFLATPTNWKLDDFLKLDIHEIHGDVANYSAISRMVERLMNKDRAGYVTTRTNWFLRTTAELALYGDNVFPTDINLQNFGQRTYLRSEFETLSFVPFGGASAKTHAVLFTIRPRVWRMDFVKAQAPEKGKEIAVSASNPLSRGHQWASLLSQFFGFTPTP